MRNSRTGRRYQAARADGWRVFLFVRKAQEDARGSRRRMRFLGQCSVSHESEKPMRIVWELEREMPPEFGGIKIAVG